MAKDDFYITLLKFIRDKTVLGEGVGYNDARAHIKSTNPEIGDEAFKRIFFNNLAEPLADFGQGHDIWIQNNTPHILTSDAYFHLLEHQELQEVRQSSMRAQLTAIAAIIISIAVGGWQIFNSATVILDESQFDLLIEAYEKSKQPPE